MCILFHQKLSGGFIIKPILESGSMKLSFFRSIQFYILIVQHKELQKLSEIMRFLISKGFFSFFLQFTKSSLVKYNLFTVKYNLKNTSFDIFIFLGNHQFNQDSVFPSTQNVSLCSIPGNHLLTTVAPGNHWSVVYLSILSRHMFESFM